LGHRGGKRNTLAAVWTVRRGARRANLWSGPCAA